MQFAFSKDPPHFHVLVGHAAFGKRSNGGRRRQNKWLKKEMQPAAGEEN